VKKYVAQSGNPLIFLFFHFIPGAKRDLQFSCHSQVNLLKKSRIILLHIYEFSHGKT
jgi:hypothetical protein